MYETTSTHLPRTFLPDQHAHLHTYVSLFEPMLSQVVLLPNMHLLVIPLPANLLPYFPGSWKRRERRNGADSEHVDFDPIVRLPRGSSPFLKIDLKSFHIAHQTPLQREICPPTAH